MERRLLLVGISVSIVLVLASAVLSFTSRPSLTGAIITPPWPAPDIHLTDQNGKSFVLSNQHGKVVLLYFGYVNCPDECPLTMAHLKLALDWLGDRAQHVRVAMVSTDPVRDTPLALGDFMDHFNPAFLGLTGRVAELQKTWAEYGVTVEQGGEAHSTFLYAVDPSGNVRETFSPSTDPANIRADVNLLLEEK
jgi:protein SCO1/2